MPRSRTYDDRDEADGAFGRLVSLASSRPFDAVAGLLAAACTAMILINALALQEARAPEPEARREASRPAPAPAAAQHRPAVQPVYSELVAQVQTALAERDLYDGVVDGLPGAATSAAIRAFEKAQGLPQTGEASEKTLASLLTAPMRKAESAKPAPAPAKPQPAAPASTGSTSPEGARLMAAQKALARIGYGPMTIDGKMGLETRNAIRSFEKDRGMAETGELSPQVLRALQSVTGAPLN